MRLACCHMILTPTMPPVQETAIHPAISSSGLKGTKSRQPSPFLSLLDTNPAMLSPQMKALLTDTALYELGQKHSIGVH